jgi:hypothetical protein
MQDAGYGHRRNHLPRRWVNKGKKEGRESSFSPGPSQGQRYVTLADPHLVTLKYQVLRVSALPILSFTPWVMVAW